MSRLPRRMLLVLAALGAGGALLAAAVFQYGMGLAPCQMCYYQCYAHGAVLVAVLSALIVPVRGLARMGALAGLASLSLAAYHTGIERKWWAGPASCGTATEDLGALSAADLLSVETAPALVRCDEIVWTFLGLSMANYNIALSFGLMALCMAAWRATRPTDRAPL